MILISLLLFPLPPYINKEYSSLYYYSDKTPAYITLNSSGQYRIDCSEIILSDYLINGVVKFEDRFFYLHPGFNPISIFKAAINNIHNPGGKVGASTITMQLARLSEPKPRTITNKIQELLRAVQIETLYSKKEILRLYLNLVPMGGNIQGVAAASILYYGKNPSDLTFAESSLLISISNSPERNRPDKDPETAESNRNRVAGRIAEFFDIDNSMLDRILETAVPTERIKFNDDIIPLIQRLAGNEDGIYSLSIDRTLQEIALNIISGAMERSQVYNGSIIVVENKNFRPIVYIGSPFYNSLHKGVRYNACMVPRTPGSTLKPFIYARALEEGLISEKTILYDIPEDYAGYKPENYSGEFLGPVPADIALYRSLNIPAITLEKDLGDNGMRNLFIKHGFNPSFLTDKDDLSVVLGSAPFTAEQMIELYGILSSDGVYRRMNFFIDEESHENKSVLTNASAYIISEILAKSLRYDLHSSWEFTKDAQKIAYKTGTGYGLVDGWAIGYTPDYTIAVWVGNLDNIYTARITGSTYAAPILFRVLNELHRDHKNWFTRPEEVGVRTICSRSGMIPTDLCADRTEELYIKNLNSAGLCDLHRRVFTDPETGIIVENPDIQEIGTLNSAVIEVWSNKVENFLLTAGKRNIQSGVSGQAVLTTSISIRSPTGYGQYLIDISKPLADQQIALRAYDRGNDEAYYWFADDEYIGHSTGGSPLLYLPLKQEIKFSVTDDFGRTGSVDARFQFIR